MSSVDQSTLAETTWCADRRNDSSHRNRCLRKILSSTMPVSSMRWRCRRICRSLSQPDERRAGCLGLQPILRRVPGEKADASAAGKALAKSASTLARMRRKPVYGAACESACGLPREMLLAGRIPSGRGANLSFKSRNGFSITRHEMSAALKVSRKISAR